MNPAPAPAAVRDRNAGSQPRSRSRPVWRSGLQPRELGLLAVFAGLTLLASLAPALPDPMAAGSAMFADGRHWQGMPNAMDVLSNLPFAVIGIWGLLRLRRIDPLHEGAHLPGGAGAGAVPANTLDCAWLFFAGLVFTAAGSAFYHLQPDALRLSADRAGMAIAFAGMIGLAVCERVSVRAGWPAACFAFAAGLLAVSAYHEHGNVMPWAVLQFGGMAVVLALAFMRPVAGATGLRLGAVILFYALAKLFELGDQAFYDATGQFVSGHSVKHMVAALAALPVFQALGGRTLRHNPGAAPAIV